ncbi:retinoblastoma-binding protein, putative [Ricinus communis]|uniref:Retinoblastoma-binding protein, putative n=1 Tax=Ricinus communis TaxID=3988 RepID=B9SY36_RICCO|nr:retinoblastoma-binding protein, putative [Ricinus communis]|eukprot:XP_002530905.1 E3 ubiquitin ligase PQT3-like [Ricinus communis]
MGIYYKFASAKDFSLIPIDGSAVSVASFKRIIFESKYKSKKKSDSNGLCLGTDLDFIVVNAQTDEQYDDDSMLIANHSSLLLRRVPGTRRRKPIDTSTIVFLEKQIPVSSLSRKTTAADGTHSVSGSSSTSTVTTKSSQDSGFSSYDQTIPGLDEDSKIKALVNTPALGCQFTSYRRMGAGIFEKKTPPEGYVCRRCHVPGHFIQHCPTNSDPNYDFKRKKTAFAAALLQQNEAAFDKQFECPTSKKSQGSPSDVPPELLCTLCKQVMKDASLTSKCCFDSFCDRCIRDHLINSKLKCVCGATQVLTDSLIPNITLRGTINRILEVGVHGNSSSAENSTSKVSSTVLSAAELSVKDQISSLDYAEDTGNKRKPVDAPNSIAKKARTAIGSMELEEVTSQGSVQAQGNTIAVEKKVQQKVVSGEKGKKKKDRRSSEDVEVGSYMIPDAFCAYNPYPYWAGMQAGMEGFYYGGGMDYGSYGMQLGR